jgi:dephospho-CoA kinase
VARPKRREKLSKDAYKRQKAALEAELTRLGLRKNHLELAMGDPAVAANFVELRRVTSELADVDTALAAAEDQWLEMEERAPVSGRPAVRIGLTGPIGCGKSTVAAWLAETPGVVAVDADVLARDVLAPGTAELAAVLARFGEDLGRPDGTLDRAALGRLVFGDEAALGDLEAIVHPAVRPRILAAIAAAEAAGAAAVVIEAIKLVEGGLAELCDEVWLVTCDPAVQVDRPRPARLERGGCGRPDRRPGRPRRPRQRGRDPHPRHVRDARRGAGRRGTSRWRRRSPTDGAPESPGGKKGGRPAHLDGGTGRPGRRAGSAGAEMEAWATATDPGIRAAAGWLPGPDLLRGGRAGRDGRAGLRRGRRGRRRGRRRGDRRRRGGRERALGRRVEHRQRQAVPNDHVGWSWSPSLVGVPPGGCPGPAAARG